MTTTLAIDPLGTLSSPSSSSIHNGRSPASASTLSSSSPRNRGEPIPSGSLRSLRSRRTELDTDLHSTSSHSRRSVRSGVRSVLSLHKTHSKSNLYQFKKATVPGGLPLVGAGGPGHPPPAYATRGIVNYEDTDNESSSCDDDDDDEDDNSSSNDSCSTFAESTNDCVANNRYLCRGMSIEIGAIGLGGDGADLSVSEFDDMAALDGEGDVDAALMADLEAEAYDELLLLTASSSLAGGGGGGAGSSVVSGKGSVVSGSSISSGRAGAASLLLDPLVEETSALPSDSPQSTPPSTPPHPELSSSATLESPTLSPALIPPLTPPQLEALTSEDLSVPTQPPQVKEVGTDEDEVDDDAASRQGEGDDATSAAAIPSSPDDGPI